MNRHDELISSLSHNLESVTPAVNIDRVALAWLLISATYVIGLTHALGPIRPDAFTQLANESRFFLESIVGVLAIVIGTLIAFRSSVPGSLRPGLTTIGIIALVL